MSSGPRLLVDMVGRSLSVPDFPRRIVSLCPSQTETLYRLGVRDRIVGTTRYCIHPRPDVEASTRVGGTKRVDLERVRGLAPDLIIAEKEENPREMVEALSGIAPVYVTDVVDPISAFEMIRRLGELVVETEPATRLIEEIRQSWSAMPKFQHPLRTAYLIWRKPWMAAGPATYIGSLLCEAGLRNVFADEPAGLCPVSRYPEFSIEQLVERRPELVLLSSEPFPFGQEHVEELRSALGGVRILLTDGEPWSWYGAGMLRFPALLRSFYNPSR